MADKETRGSERLVDNGGWLWQERALDGATSDKRGWREYEDAVTMLAAMLPAQGPVADYARRAGGE